MPTDWLSDDDIARLLALSSDLRTAVLVRMLLLEGFGLAEVVALDHADVTGTAPSMSATLERRGRQQSLPLQPSTADAVSALRAGLGTDGPLLTSARPGDVGQRITRFGADYLLKQAADAAGIAGLSANTLRRSHAVAAERNGVHILDTRDRMGHRDVRTTHRHLADPESPRNH